jgi:hypothetical protein
MRKPLDHRRREKRAAFQPVATSPSGCSSRPRMSKRKNESDYYLSVNF